MRSSRRISAANRRNSIAGRWRPWLWDTTADETANETVGDAPTTQESLAQIPLWVEDTPPALGGPTLLD